MLSKAASISIFWVFGITRPRNLPKYPSKIFVVKGLDSNLFLLGQYQNSSLKKEKIDLNRGLVKPHLYTNWLGLQHVNSNWVADNYHIYPTPPFGQDMIQDQAEFNRFEFRVFLLLD